MDKEDPFPKIEEIAIDFACSHYSKGLLIMLLNRRKILCMLC